MWMDGGQIMPVTYRAIVEIGGEQKIIESKDHWQIIADARYAIQNLGGTLILFQKWNKGTDSYELDTLSFERYHRTGGKKGDTVQSFGASARIGESMKRKNIVKKQGGATDDDLCSYAGKVLLYLLEMGMTSKQLESLL